jgi:hypothetical protein
MYCVSPQLRHSARTMPYAMSPRTTYSLPRQTVHGGPSTVFRVLDGTMVTDDGLLIWAFRFYSL